MEFAGVTKQTLVHETIFEFANLYFYGGKVKSTVEGFDLPATYLQEIRRLCHKTEASRINPVQRRWMYFQIQGFKHARASRDTGSRANIRSLNFVMWLIDGPLYRIWGEDMNKKVVIVTLYLRQKELYEIKLEELRKKGWSIAALPQVLTVDEASGRIFDHAVLDPVNCLLTADGMDTFADEKRTFSTFFTRGAKAAWIVGGDHFPHDGVPDQGRTFKYNAEGKEIVRKWDEPHPKSLQRKLPNGETVTKYPLQYYQQATKNAQWIQAAVSISPGSEPAWSPIPTLREKDWLCSVE